MLQSVPLYRIGSASVPGRVWTRKGSAQRARVFGVQRSASAGICIRTTSGPYTRGRPNVGNVACSRRRSRTQAAQRQDVESLSAPSTSPVAAPTDANIIPLCRPRDPEAVAETQQVANDPRASFDIGAGGARGLGTHPGAVSEPKKTSSWASIPQAAASNAGSGLHDVEPPSRSEEPAPPLHEILAHLGNLLREDVGLLATAIVFLIAATGAELTIPGLVGDCIFAASSAASDGGSLLRSRLVALLTAATALGVAARCRSVAFCTLNARLLERLRTRVFASIIEQPVGWFDSIETGQLTSRLGADSASISRFVATSANVALRSGLQCAGAAIALAYLCPPMAAACIAVGTIQAIATIACGEYLRVTQRAYQDGLAASSGVAEESFLLSRIIRTFGTERAATRTYAKTLGVLTRIYVKQGHVYSATLGLNLWLSSAMRVAALLCGANAAMRGQLDARRLTSFMLYVDMFASGAHTAAEQFGPVMESLGASERVVAFLAKKPAPQLSAGVRPERITGTIEFRDVSFAYPARPDVLALRGVSLCIPAGKRVAIVGLSGSGKSSLVALLQRLYEPTSGSILIDGTDLRSLDSGWFRDRLGVVGQDPRLFSIPVGANIAYGCPSATRSDVVAAARAANAAGFIDALPQGYDTPVTDRLLSGGQKQRIAIARALARDPSILLLDEATSALDSESEAAVQAALDRAMLVAGRTVVVIAHRLSTVRNADFTVVMSAGRVAELGTHDELIARDGIYAALVRRQVRGRRNARPRVAPFKT